MLEHSSLHEDERQNKMATKSVNVNPVTKTPKACEVKHHISMC